MYRIVYTNRMKKDVKRAKKRGKNLSKLIDVNELILLAFATGTHSDLFGE